MRLFLMPMLAGASLAGGCAAIVTGNTQEMRVETHYNARQVTGAQCELTNSKGTYQITTPGTILITRAYDALQVRCVLDTLQPGLATVHSSTKPIVFGNALVGGLIGVAIDTTSGAAFGYPEQIRVDMGIHQSITTESASEIALEDGPAAAAPAPPPAVAAPAQLAASPSAPGVQRGGQPLSMEALSGVLPAR